MSASQGMEGPWRVKSISCHALYTCRVGVGRQIEIGYCATYYALRGCFVNHLHVNDFMGV